MKRIVSDQLNRKVVVPLEPRRIVSLVPSLTEYLIDLQIGERLRGITRYCSRTPDIRKDRTVVGGTKKFDFEKIDALKPDLLFANKEENYPSGVQLLSKQYPVWISDINNLEQALSAMQTIAEMVNSADRGKLICQKIQTALWRNADLQQAPAPSVCYLIWKKPWMVCGSDNFIDDMLRRAGFENLFSSHIDRYPAVTVEQLSELQPDYVFLSSEPFPFKDSHVNEISALLPAAQVLLVDAEPFSWYGSRLLHSADYFSSLRNRLGLDWRE